MKQVKFDAAALTKISKAKAWRVDAAQEGLSVIAGTVFAIVPRTGDYGKYPVVIFDTVNDETVAIHAFHSVLFNQLRELRVHPGMDLVFTYAGKREKNKTEANGEKRQYHDWTVVPADGAEIDTYDFTTDEDEPQF